jgi:hypothetical protein
MNDTSQQLENHDVDVDEGVVDESKSDQASIFMSIDKSSNN